MDNLFLSKNFNIPSGQVIINNKTRELSEIYTDEDAYGSRSTLWRRALNDGVVSEELYSSAMNYYGKLWNYVGD